MPPNKTEPAFLYLGQEGDTDSPDHNRNHYSPWFGGGVHLFWDADLGPMIPCSEVARLSDLRTLEFAKWYREHGEELQALGLALACHLQGIQVDHATYKAIKDSTAINDETKLKVLSDLLELGCQPAPTDTRAGGYVYLMRNDLGLYKIGISGDLQRRAAELRRASGTSVEVVAAKFFDRPSVEEHALHEQFSDRRANGEWFKLSDEDVGSVLKVLEG